MRAMVVYESMYGNTKAVAEAIGKGLGRYGEVEVTDVGHATRVDEVDLLVVGAPTHIMGMSRPQTREQAAARTPSGHAVTEGDGMREWIDALPATKRHVAVAAFDTKLMRPFAGSAAKKAAHRLESKGYRLVTEPAHFGVTASEVPELDDGELEHAEHWADDLGRRMAATG